MKVRESGEFRLIRLLAQTAELSGIGADLRPDVLIGVGDDAAAWHGEGIELATTDILVEGTHFTLETTSWHDLGWKALAVNVSDIAAMGGSPTYALVSLGLPADTDTDSVAQLYQGMAQLARPFGMAIIGGNVSEAPLVIINPTVIGKSPSTPLTRSAAKPGDQIAVTGHLGASAAGLRLLLRERGFDPDLVKVLRDAHRRPAPRVTEAQILRQSGVRSAIDLSDGLIADLGHMCELSQVAAEVFLPSVPIHPLVRKAFATEALPLAISGGEDYELLFTAPPDIVEKVRDLITLPVTTIGRIILGTPGSVTLLDEAARPVQPSETGWEHFRGH